jgi:hypothetical protein
MRDRIHARVASLGALLLLASVAQAGGLAPWQFGMSHAEIEGQMSYGPYRSFSNGDLETYNGDFAGRKRNVQFYIENDALIRIAVRMYEGTDITAATAAWRETNTALRQQFGAIDMPYASAQATPDFAEQAADIVVAGGKAQMAPSKQHKSEFVFATYSTFEHDSSQYYMVTVNFDPPKH